MKIIVFLILGLFLFSSEQKNFTVLGILSRTGSFSCSENGSAIYIMTDYFEDVEEIEFEFWISNGYITENYVYYGNSDTEIFGGDSISLSLHQSYYSSESESDDLYYSKNTYFFIIPKPKEKYLYVSFPPFALTHPPYNEQMTVRIVNKKNTGVIIGIVIGAVILAAIIIILIIFFIKRKKKRSNINPSQGQTVDDYPVAPPVEGLIPSNSENTPSKPQKTPSVEPDYPPLNEIQYK